MTELQHLHNLYTQLTTDIASLTQQLAALGEEGRAVKAALGHEHLDLGTASDRVDTFATIETGNRQIDALNARAQTARTRLNHATLLRPQAYFARLNLDYGDGDPEALYLGKVGYADADANDLVYDWRAPVADVYYANRTGATSYRANDREIPVTLTGRTQFVIDHDRLIQAIDTETAVGDPLLLAALAANREGLREITATIQAEQNAIIRDPRDVVIATGVAGSGKTSVLLQRVAYQLYRHRGEWAASAVLIVTPNRAFGRYIRGVLLALGEAEPVSSTLADLLANVGRHFGLAVAHGDRPTP